MKVDYTRYKFRFTHGELILHGNTVNGKKIMSLILDKTSEFINKWLEESCVEFEKEIEVSGNSESYFSNESETFDEKFGLAILFLMNF